MTRTLTASSSPRTAACLFAAVHHNAIHMSKLQHAFYALLIQVNHLIYVFFSLFGTCPGDLKMASDVYLQPEDSLIFRFLDFRVIYFTWTFLLQSIELQLQLQEMFVNPLYFFSCE